MTTPKELGLHRVGFSPLPVGVSQWHVFDHPYAWNAPNPYSKGRHAWRDGAHGNFYTSLDPMGALFESVFRRAKVRIDAASGMKLLYVDPAALAGKAIVELILVQENGCLDLRPGNFAALVDPGSPLDNAWAQLHAAVRYHRSWTTTLELAQLVAAHAVPRYPILPALAWRSRRLHSSTVYLHFDPPIGSDAWLAIGGPLDLDSAAGLAKLKVWCINAGFVLVVLPFDSAPDEDL